MNKKIDLFYGVLIAFAATLIGTWLLIAYFTDLGFVKGLQDLHAKDKLGKVIALGAALNIVAFFVLLNRKKEIMARGVVLGTIILTVVTLLV